MIVAMQTPTQAADAAARDYDRRAEAAAADRARLDTASRRWARARLAIAAVVAGGVVAALSVGTRAGWGLAAAGALGFALAAARHARVDAARSAAAVTRALNRDASARARRQWSETAPWEEPPTEAAPDEAHPYAADLDLFGHASLWRLLGRARTPRGDAVLRAWSLAPSTPEDVEARQATVRALAPLLDWRQRLAADALQARRMRPHEVERFLAWCEGGPWLRRRRWIYLLALVLAVASPLLIAGDAAGLVSGGWLASLGAAVVLSLALQGPLARTLEDASWEAALRGWRGMAASLAAIPAEDPRLAALRDRVAGSHPAVAAFDALDRVLGFAGLRHTPVLHWPLQAVTLWDFHLWWAVEGWQRRHGLAVRGWIEAIAEVEALSALAGLAGDHPHWCWPRVARDEARLEAEGLVHPLLPPSAAVPNDVTLGPPGRLLFVTGSNMSGKSTLLRAIGLNVVLAQMGGPVAASAWRMPPLALVTSMRLHDSLEDGVSFFMASLKRLKLVVTHAEDATRDPSRPMTLYLLDELLGGTNTAEREVAVRGVVRHLVARRAIGALTSHDLGLADAPELRAHADAVHFRESLAAEGAATGMTFDYRLRPGVATSRNALALMRAVGLGELVG